jgi:ABC-type lipoprotein release transport system permease subunit
MMLYLRLAWRNIWRHRRRTLIVVLSVGLGMMLMMFYDGLVAGFEEAIYANAIKVLGGNMQVHAPGYLDNASRLPLTPLADDAAVLKALRAQPQVESASRRIKTSGMVTSRAGAFGVTIIGIEPQEEQKVSLLAKNVTAGRFLQPADSDMVFIGNGLAEAMNIQVGDRVTLAGRATHDQVRTRTVTVVGIYDVGIKDIEKTSVYLSLAEAQSLYGLDGQATEVAVTLQHLGQEPAVTAAVLPLLSGIEIASWKELFPEMTETINAKGKVMDIFSVVILLIAGIGILNLLLMAVFERTREIGVLAALGMKSRQIWTLFVLEGAMMGAVGLVFGLGLGLLTNFTLMQTGVDFSKFATLTSYTALLTGKIYPTLGLQNMLSRSITVLVIALLASFYPAREASRSEPAKALHFV